MSGFAALSIATALVFHPYSAPSTAAYLRTAPAEPTGSQPGWEEIEAENAAESAAAATEVPPPVVDPTSVAPNPGTVPPPAVAKPQYSKGTGLIIGAGVTGGLAWVAGLTRMAFVGACIDKLRSSDTIPEGGAATRQCAFQAGVGNVVLAGLQMPLNGATWGLAAAAGVVRGRYDGVEHAWGTGKNRKSAAFIGAGAALLAVGIIGRITAAVLVFRPYGNFARDMVDAGDDTAKIDDAVSRLSGSIRGRLFGVQLSSATIGAGAGLLGYGISWRKNHDSESRRLQQVRVAPQLDFDPRTGYSFTGVSMSARF